MRHGLGTGPPQHLFQAIRNHPTAARLFPGTDPDHLRLSRTPYQPGHPISAARHQRLSKIEACLRRVDDAELWVLAKARSGPMAELFPARPKQLTKILRQGRG